MTEIKLTKRYPQSRTEDIVDAYMRGWNDALDAVQNGKFHINEAEQTEPQTDCYMCKWLGEVDVCGRCRNRNLFAEADTEPQQVVRLKHFKCPKCGRSDYIRSFEDWGVDGGIYKYKCINCNTYIKDEPNCSEKPNNCEWSVEYAKEMLDTMPCEDCGHWEHGAGDHYYCALLEMRQECCFESKDESTLMFANKPKDEPQTDVYDYKGNGKWERSE